jgi:hypothetical protein
MEYKLAREEHTRILNPYQSAYLLLDNGTRNPDNSVLEFRAHMDKFFASKTVHQLEGQQHSNVLESARDSYPCVQLVL